MLLLALPWVKPALDLPPELGGLVAEDGYIALPTAPGLGLDIDEKALARYPYQEFRARTIRHPGDEGP